MQSLSVDIETNVLNDRDDRKTCAYPNNGRAT